MSIHKLVPATIITLLAIFCVQNHSAAATDVKRSNRDAVVYVAAHPDDLAGSIGTVMRLAEMYDVHVVDYTHGERGMGNARFIDGSCKKMRTEEEERICREIGVALHWCDEIDGAAFAGKEACQKLAGLFTMIKPRALIVHWPLDVHKDHIMSYAAAIKAAQMAKISPEIYFQEQDLQSRNFPVAYSGVYPFFE